MKALIILNHTPVDGVYRDLEKLGCTQIDLLKDVNEMLAIKFANVPFDLSEDHTAHNIMCTIARDEPDGYNVVVISGEPRMVHRIIKACDEQAFQTSFYAPYSKRISLDEIQSDGSIKKVVKFQYEGLASY